MQNFGIFVNADITCGTVRSTYYITLTIPMERPRKTWIVCAFYTKESKISKSGDQVHDFSNQFYFSRVIIITNYYFILYQ